MRIYLGHLHISFVPNLVVIIVDGQVKALARVLALVKNKGLGGWITDNIVDLICVLNVRQRLESDMTDGGNA